MDKDAEIHSLEGKVKAEPSGGRPNKAGSALRTATLIEIATAFFLERGYAATSLEQIASTAGVGKRTLYARFPDKPSLFIAAIGHVLDRWHDPEILLIDGSLQDRLIKAGNIYCELTLSTEGIALYRLLTIELRGFPETAEMVERELEQRGPYFLETMLRRCLDDGLLRDGPGQREVSWARDTGRILAGAFTSEPRRRILTGRNIMAPTEIAQWVQKVVKIFIGGLQ